MNQTKAKKSKRALNGKIMLIGIIFLLPATVAITFTILIPIIWNLVISFFEWNGNSKMKFVGMDNYTKIFAEKATSATIIHSLQIAVIATLVAMLLGIFLSLLIYKMAGTEGAIYRFIFFSPSMIPLTIISFLFIFILSPDMGLLNNVLGLLGLENLQHAWLAEPSTVLWTIAIVQGWRFSGVIMMLCYTGIVGIPEELFESSKLDGCGYLRQLKYIILPLMKPTIQLALSMMLIWAFKTYDIVWAMTKGGPGDLSKTIPIRMIETGFTFNQYGYSASIGIVFTVLVMIFIIIGRRVLKGEVYEY